MRKKTVICPNPSCPTNTEQDKGMKLGPNNVLYKCEKPGRDTHYFTAPKTLFNTWSKHVISPFEEFKDVKVDTDTVYCPQCHAPIYLGNDIVRVAVVGPRNCGKTVYLTVLNELIGNPEYMGRLRFDLAKKTEAFSFTVRYSGNDKRYVLPRPTQVNGSAAGAANIPYMDYHVTLGVDELELAALMGHDAGNGDKSKGKKNNGTIEGKSLEMYFYDVAGEWFMPQEKVSRDMLDNDSERNRKLAYLYEADLILFMIDSRQIAADDAEDVSHLTEKSELSFEEYGRAIRERIIDIRSKNHKDYYVAFCYLSVDIFKQSQSAYNLVTKENFDFRLKRADDTFDAAVFNWDKYDECVRTNLRTFKKFNRIFGSLVNENSDGKPMLDVSRMGVFSISSLGPKATVISKDSGYGTEKYLDSFDPTNSWGVVDPILWYLSERGIISQAKSKK